DARHGRGQLRRRGGRVSQYQHGRRARRRDPFLTEPAGLQFRRWPRPRHPRPELSRMSAPPKSLLEASCADDYDPNSMPVDRARELIRTFLSPLTATERVHIRQALDRILSADVVSPHDVPGHDNSAMDGYAVRFADLARDAETVLVRVGESFAGRPSATTVGPGQCVRIFTGGVMPAGADTVVMQERTRAEGDRVHVAANAVAKAGTNRRYAGEDLKRGEVVFEAGQRVRAAELGL